MKVYVAGPWKHRTTAAETATLLRDNGHTIVSRWHDVSDGGTKSDGSDTHPEVCMREAQMDIDDVRSADLVLVLNIEVSEGKALEQGIALAANIPIMVIGKRSNVFHYLPQIVVVSSIHEAIRHLKALTISQHEAELAR